MNSLVIKFDSKGNIIDFNKYAEKMLGLKKEEAIGKYNIFDFVAAGDKRQLEELKEKYRELQISWERLRKSEERYRLIAEASDIGVWDWDLSDGEKYYSDKWYENLDLKPDFDGDLDETWTNAVYPEDLPGIFKEIDKHLAGLTTHYEFEYRIRTKYKECKWIKAIGKTLRDENGKPLRRAGSDTDITELKDYQERLHYLAYRDSLTGLPNRLMLNEELSKWVSEKTGKKCAMFFIDTDNFKLVNDTLGHQFGDRLIVEIGKRLELLLGNDGVVFRIGGDEFILFTPYFEDVDKIANFADKIIQGFKKTFEVYASILNVSISIGISIYPDHGTSPDELLKNADIAMYKAKESGKGRYVIFSEVMNNTIIERMNIEKYLNKALDNNEFMLYYQPQIDVKTGAISGFEALVRWNSPDLGIISPLKFIRIAEESKLIIPLGGWVLYNACYFIKKIHELGYEECTISVNISIIQLIQDNFVDMVLKTLEDTKLESRFLELEITESVLMESFGELNRKLDLLRNKGVGIALDDFGKGYSSLNYLKQLSISTLKIDKSFIDSISNSEKNDTLIGTIMLIGRKMGLSVVAEGVETNEQLDYLVDNRCDKIQGFLFSKPLPENEAIHLLDESKGILTMRHQNITIRKRL